MTNFKNEYEKNKEIISKTEGISELERGNLYFANWFNYITNWTSISENDSIKYEREKIRVKA